MKEKKGAYTLAFIILAILMVALQIGVISFIYWLLTLCFPITFKIQYAIGIYILLNITKLIINFLKSN